MSPPTQYRLYGRRFLQVKRPNQQYQSTEGEDIAYTGKSHSVSWCKSDPCSSRQVVIKQAYFPVLQRFAL